MLLSNVVSRAPTTMTTVPTKTKVSQPQALWSRISKWVNTSQSLCQLRAMFTLGVWMTKASLASTRMPPTLSSLKQSLTLRVISQKLSRRSPAVLSIVSCLQRITNYTHGVQISYFNLEGNCRRVNNNLWELVSNNNKWSHSLQSEIIPHLPVMSRHLMEQSLSKSCAVATTIFVWVIDCQRLRIRTKMEETICSSWMPVKTITTKEVQARVQLPVMRLARKRSKFKNWKVR